MAMPAVTRVYTPGSCCNSRHRMRHPPRWGMRLDSPALHAEQSRIPNQTLRRPQKGIRHPIAEVDKKRWRVLFKVPLKTPGSCGSCHIPSWGPRNVGVLKSLRGMVCAVVSLLGVSISGSHQNGDVSSTVVRRVSLALLHIPLPLTWPIPPPISI